MRGAMLCARAFVQANLGQPYGRIINIASTRWQQNEAGWDAYGASKGALVAFTQSLAISLAEYPITVNAISPGWIQAEDYHTLTEEDHRQHPSGRVGRPDDITRACLFLADPNNDFINGANLVIDGGMSKKMIYHTSASFWQE
ncbi:MAG: SDR family NAD(P)-dependent oxidoreductase [Vibrionaceae bacterium]